MARVNVFLSEELLKVVDAEAEQAGLNRSALMQRALGDYLEGQRRAREEAEIQRRMDEACKKMDALAQKLGVWDPVRIIREFRESRDSAGQPQSHRGRTRRRR